MNMNPKRVPSYNLVLSILYLKCNVMSQYFLCKIQYQNKKLLIRLWNLAVVRLRSCNREMVKINIMSYHIRRILKKYNQVRKQYFKILFKLFFLKSIILLRIKIRHFFLYIFTSHICNNSIVR